MTKVEIDGRTYCVETLIYGVERLTKDVKASAEYHRLVLEQIKAEIASYKDDKVIHAERNEMIDIVLEIIDKYKK